jgi:SRSO17 transposase
MHFWIESCINEIALKMIQEIVSEGKFNIKWIGCDSAFGSDHGFLDALTIPYFAAVKSNERIFGDKSSQRPQEIKTFSKCTDISWQKRRVGLGSKGAIYADVKIFRAISCRSLDGLAKHHEDIWVYIRKYDNGDIRYSISNACHSVSEKELHEAATLRWPIEQCFKECKSYLGMGHYEGRTYGGLLRHWLFVMIAHFFITGLRIELKKLKFQ